MAESLRPRIAILTSGNGTTAEAFILAAQKGHVNADVGLVVCSKPRKEAGVYERIDRLNQAYDLAIETVEINGRTHPAGKVGRGQTLTESEAIQKRVQDAGCGHVALMGYMRIVRGNLLDAYGWRQHYTSPYQARMSNTHPGPLPETADTYGVHASERVLELGMEYSAHTFHLVGVAVDEGPILAEHPVQVLDDDSPESLFARVQAAEKVALPYAMGQFLREQAAFLG
jgi:phosphoribosylglycinamide formyltransferase-1